MRVTVLSGGVGGARFLLGLRRLGVDITVIGNTGDDLVRFGLRICPDLDTVMYTLGGGISGERGWGREDETFRVRDEASAYDGDLGWFGLGDLDLATHLARTHWLGEGATLTEVTERLCRRWRPGVRLLPMTDDPVHTVVHLADGRDLHFQEWWVRERAAPTATGFTLAGATMATAAPGVEGALTDTDLVVLPPSNPVVSLGTILEVPGIRSALRASPAPVVGLSPIVGGAPLRGMADACLTAIGVETSAAAVGRHYGARSADGVIDAWLVDETDADAVPLLEQAGIAARAVPLLMHDEAATEAMAQAAVDLALSVRR